MPVLFTLRGGTPRPSRPTSGADDPREGAGAQPPRRGPKPWDSPGWSVPGGGSTTPRGGSTAPSSSPTGPASAPVSGSTSTTLAPTGIPARVMSLALSPQTRRWPRGRTMVRSRSGSADRDLPVPAREASRPRPLSRVLPGWPDIGVRRDRRHAILKDRQRWVRPSSPLSGKSGHLRGFFSPGVPAGGRAKRAGSDDTTLS